MCSRRVGERGCAEGATVRHVAFKRLSSRERMISHGRDDVWTVEVEQAEE
jgi:hypothetical protein